MGLTYFENYLNSKNRFGSNFGEVQKHKTFKILKSWNIIPVLSKKRPNNLDYQSEDEFKGPYYFGQNLPNITFWQYDRQKICIPLFSLCTKSIGRKFRSNTYLIQNFCHSCRRNRFNLNFMKGLMKQWIGKWRRLQCYESEIVWDGTERGKMEIAKERREKIEYGGTLWRDYKIIDDVNED